MHEMKLHPFLVFTLKRDALIKWAISGYPPRDVYNSYAVYGISVIYREHVVLRGGKPYIANGNVYFHYM